MKIGLGGLQRFFQTDDAKTTDKTGADKLHGIGVAEKVEESFLSGAFDFISDVFGGDPSTDDATVRYLEAGKTLKFPAAPLLPEEAIEMQGLTSYVERGVGELEGVIALREPTGGSPMRMMGGMLEPVLVTYKGRRLEVAYKLDIPLAKAEELLGKRVKVDAEFERAIDQLKGTGKGAKVTEILGTTKASRGEEVRLRGEIRGAIFQAGGSPNGNYLRLSEAIKIGDKEFDMVQLKGGQDLSKYQLLDVTKKLQFFSNEDGTETAFVELEKSDRIGAHVKGEPPRALTNDELMKISDLSTMSLEGKGVLQGQLVFREDASGAQKPCLVTSRVGRGEAKFFPDISLADARKLEGQIVQLGGVIRQGIDPNNNIKGTKIKGVVSPDPEYQSGDNLTLAGIVYQRQQYTEKGVQNYTELMLPKPIILDGKRIQKIILKGAEGIDNKAKLRLDGTLSVRPFQDSQGQEHFSIELDSLENLRQAIDIPMFYADTETLVNDFERESPERLEAVVPEDQTID